MTGVDHVDRPRADPAAPERWSDEQVVALAILMPVVLLLLFGSFQIALLYHGRTLAIAAAQEGARTAAALGGTASAGQAAAEQFVATTGGGTVLVDATVTVTLDPAQATVVVSGSTTSLVPGWHPTLTGRASAPVERLTTG